MLQRFRFLKNPITAVGFSNVTASAPLHCRFCCTSPLPHHLQKVFGATNWATFTARIPNWESNLKLADFSTLDAKLQLCGFDPLTESPAMATALMEHFKQIDVPGLYQAIESAQLVKSGDVEKLILTNFSWLTHARDVEAEIVYVREAYKRLWDVVKRAHAHSPGSKVIRSDVLVIGNPGIGKSWCLNYLLYLALTEKLTSLVILRSRQGWYCFHNGTCNKYQEYPGEAWVNNKLKPGERGLLLHDIGKAKAKSLFKFEAMDFGRVCIVLASSPKEENYTEFQSHYAPVKFYCPMLSRDEFASIHPQRQREFEQFGGCLRGVGDASREKDLLWKMRSFDFSKVSLDLISENDTHRLVQVVPEVGNSEEFHLDFVSKYVEKMFFNTQWEALKDDILKKLYENLNNLSVRQLYGIPFENYVQEYAHKLDFKKLTNIDGSAPSPSIIPSNFSAPSGFKLVATNNSDLHKKVEDSKSAQGRWIQPKISNFPVLDAFLVFNNKVYGIQTTISDTHQPQTSKLKALLAQGVSFGNHSPKQKIHLDGVIFVVDEYRRPLLSKPQLVPMSKDGRPNKIADEWKSNNPQFRLLVSCKEWSM